MVSVDPHEGYRSAITGSPLLGEITMVVDPFHIVRLANQALTRCRQRIQQATLGHRGWPPIRSTTRASCSCSAPNASTERLAQDPGRVA